MEIHQKVDWWKDFFTGLTVDMWRAAMSEDQTRSEADFIYKSFNLNTSARVLDVPCGNGRISLQLAKRGLRITGIDLSEEFLSQAISEAAGQKLQVTFERREMRELPWRDEFDGAVCWGNSFGYLDDRGNADFLKSVHRVLKPGARFILDASSIAEVVLPQIQERSEMQFGDILFKEENIYDHTVGRLNTRYTFVRGSKTEERFGSHRIYTYEQLNRLLKDTGFSVAEANASLTREPFHFGAKQLYLVITRSR